ncbi:MAG: histidine phosphatase family protein [Chloroflexi bacterium]|nr:histidine phosphatase family protein [Chloroflexota bacterium]
MTIYLVRHGLAAAGTAELDPGLATLGHAQARAAANRLWGANAGRLLVSPLRRTRETAEPIAAALGLAEEIREEVAEVFDPSMPVQERQAMIGPFMAGKWADQPEQLRAWRRRVVDTVLEAGLAASAAGHDLVIVSHYIAIGVVIGESVGDDRVVPQPMANASITTVEVGHGGFTLVEAASVTHLAPEEITGAGSAMAGGGNAPRQ